MKFGDFVFPESRDPSRDTEIFQETVAQARYAEDIGMDAVWLAEHHFDGACVYADPTTFAAGLATATKKIQIGFAVIQVSLYHPLSLAERLSIVDQLSQGRLLVGLGRGSNFNAYEYAGFGVDQSEAQERFEESEEILLKCWKGGPVQHHGKYWQFEIPGLRPRPYQEPHPTILHSVTREDSTIALAGKGIPFLMLGSIGGLATLLKRMQLFQDSMARAGFNEKQIQSTLDQSWAVNHVVVAQSDKEAESIGIPAFDLMMEYRQAQVSKYGMKKGAGTLTGPLCGSPDTIIEQLAPLARSGVGGLVNHFRFGPMAADVGRNSANLFMSEVAPELRRIRSESTRSTSTSEVRQLAG